MQETDQCTYQSSRTKGIVRHAPGVRKPVRVRAVNFRYKSCRRAVTNRETKKNTRPVSIRETGQAQNKAIQSLASPADIWSKYQAVKTMTHSIPMTKLPGK